MGESAVTLNPYVVYSLLGFITLAQTATIALVIRLIFRLESMLTEISSE